MATLLKMGTLVAASLNTWCQYYVNGWNILVVLHLISLYGSTHSIVYVAQSQYDLNVFLGP